MQKQNLYSGGREYDRDIEYYRKEWHNYYVPVVQLVPHGSYVLDIGCGRGGMLEYLRDKKGCRVMGVDISDEPVEICRRKNIEAVVCDIEQENIPGKYDVLIMSAVFEHMLEPLVVLEKLKDNLNDGGCLIIGVPNFSQLSSRIGYLMGKNVKKYGDSPADDRLGIQPLGHIQFFNKPTLTYLLKRTGYDPVEWNYLEPVFSANWRKSLIGFLRGWPSYRLRRSLKYPLFRSFIVVKANKLLANSSREDLL